MELLGRIVLWCALPVLVACLAIVAAGIAWEWIDTWRRGR